MLLKVNGCELEIVEDKFVCFAVNDGENSHFCEWKYLDEDLQERFESLRLELLEVMRKFVVSDTRDIFQSIAEEYSVDGSDKSSVLPMIPQNDP